MVTLSVNKRFILETGKALEIANIVEPIAEELGLQLVRVLISGRDGCTIQVMIDCADRNVNVDDCAHLSRRLSPVLDAEDPIAGKYHLEISSPGIDRPLVRLSDFDNWAGYEVKIVTKMLIDGRKRFRGFVEGHNDTEVLIKLKLDTHDEPQTIGFLLEYIESAKLVMTDELIKKALDNSGAK